MGSGPDRRGSGTARDRGPRHRRRRPRRDLPPDRRSVTARRHRTTLHQSTRRGALPRRVRVAMRGIRPRTSSSETCAVWPEVVEHAASIGVAVNAWTVALYQPWIVDTYPDCARVLPSGDPVGSSVCAANDDVREYMASLCADVVDQFGVRMLRLEGIMPAAYDYGWLRPRVLVDVSPLARSLLALCFCASCTRRATVAGLDVERLRRLVQGTIAAELDDAAPRPRRPSAPRRLDADAELQAFVMQHERASIELAQVAMSCFESRASAPSLAVVLDAVLDAARHRAERPARGVVRSGRSGRRVPRVVRGTQAPLRRCRLPCRACRRARPPAGTARRTCPGREPDRDAERADRWRRSSRARRRSASTRSTSTTTGCSGRTTSATSWPPSAPRSRGHPRATSADDVDLGDDVDERIADEVAGQVGEEDARGASVATLTQAPRCAA